MQHFIMQHLPPLVCLLALKATFPALLSISKANWPVFGRPETSVTQLAPRIVWEPLPNN